MPQNKLLSITIASCLLAGCNSTNKMNVEPSVFSGKATEPNQIELSSLNKDREALPQFQELDALLDKSDIKAIESDLFPTFSEELDLQVASNKLPLEEFVNYIFSDLLNANFVLNATLSKNETLTLNLSKPVSQNQLFSIVRATLAERKIGIKFNDDLFYIYSEDGKKNKNNASIGIGRQADDLPINGENIYQIIPLKYINNRDIQTLILDLTSATTSVYERANALLVRGSRSEVLRVIKIINTLDVPSANGRHIAMYKLTYLSPKEFKESIREILDNEGVSGGGSGKTKVYSITTMDRLNALIVHSSESEVISRIRYWVEKLDIPEAAAEKQYLTYFPQYTKASEISEAITHLLNAESGSQNISNQVGNRPTGQSSNLNQSIRPNSQQQANAGSTSSITTSSTKDMAVVADDKRNALIFYTAPAKFQSLLPIIKQLDVPPLQVVLETKILEVTLTNEFKHGVEWYLNKGNYSLASGLGDLPGGLAWTLTGTDYNAAINLLDTENQVEILSSPRVVVRDGESATINVGTEVPIVIGQTSTVENPNNIQQQIQYRNTGVILNVTANINARGLVSLDVNQEVSEAGENKIAGISSPIILNRSLNTKVIAASGQTIVLGGLISENNGTNEARIPLLSDIPILGNLFKNESKSKVRTELVIVITPKVLYGKGDLEGLNDIFNQELQFFNF